VRRAALLLALIAFFAATVAGGSSASGRGQSRARLMLLDTDPLTFRGTGFKPHERVRIVVDESGEAYARSATGSAAGAFTMRMPGVGASGCAGFAATATGNRGSRATFKRPHGQCPLP
jgi:hypothetical protein